jgi:hypothetical protein
MEIVELLLCSSLILGLNGYESGGKELMLPPWHNKVIVAGFVNKTVCIGGCHILVILILIMQASC